LKLKVTDVLEILLSKCRKKIIWKHLKLFSGSFLSRNDTIGQKQIAEIWKHLSCLKQQQKIPISLLPQSTKCKKIKKMWKHEFNIVLSHLCSLFNSDNLKVLIHSSLFTAKSLFTSLWFPNNFAFQLFYQKK